MKIHLVGAMWFRVGGQRMDRHYKANSCFSQCWKHVQQFNMLIVCGMNSMASESKIPENEFCAWGFHFHPSLWEESFPSLLSLWTCLSTSCHLELLSKDVTAVYRETVHCKHYLVTLLVVLTLPCRRCKVQWWTQCSDPYHKVFSLLAVYSSLYQSCANLDFHHS